MNMITIVNYGMGNLGSILNMFNYLGFAAEITSDPAKISQASKLILPGVGAFDNGMQELENKNLVEALNESVLRKKVPILGICLGMQLMTNKSEEGGLPGLGWFDVDTIKFSFSGGQCNQLKIPHMGWNFVRPRRDSLLLKNLSENSKFYFVHSFHIPIKENGAVLLETTYGFPFASALEKENIMAVQFHPEKSHRYGLQLFKNFAENF